jgi:hypothetical protein
VVGLSRAVHGAQFIMHGRVQVGTHLHHRVNRPQVAQTRYLVKRLQSLGILVIHETVVGNRIVLVVAL